MKRILSVLIAVSVAACASKPQPSAMAATGTSTPASPISRSAYSSDLGELPVGAIPNAVVHDAQRNRDVVMSIEYPTRGGPYPVIVMSHGFGGSPDTYISLSEYWASYGYVVIKPAHADAGALRKLSEEQRAADAKQTEADLKDKTKKPNSKEARAAADARRRANNEALEAAANDLASKQGPEDFRNRVRDLTLAIDALPELQHRYVELQGRVDATKIGVAGHSYGAFTALLIAGAHTYRDPSTASMADPRVKAVVTMVPPGLDESIGMRTDSWNDIHLPVLFMTGTNGHGLIADQVARRAAYDHSPTGDKYFALIPGARLMSFTGRPTAVEDLPLDRRPNTNGYNPNGYPGYPNNNNNSVPLNGTMMGMSFGNEKSIFGTIERTSLAFFDNYLKDKSTGREYLTKSVFTGATIESK